MKISSTTYETSIRPLDQISPYNITIVADGGIKKLQVAIAVTHI